MTLRHVNFIIAKTLNNKPHHTSAIPKISSLSPSSKLKLSPALSLSLAITFTCLSAACSDSGGDNASNKGLEGDASISANQEGGTLRPDGGTLTDAMAEADSATERDSKTTQTTDSSLVVVTGEKVVTYDARQGVFTGSASVKVKDGETVSKPTEPTRPAYVFTGWYTEASEANQNETTRFKFKDEANVTPSSVTSDITLYAGWRRLGLQDVVEQRKLPSDLSLYDEVTQAALGAYKAEATAGASVSAIFVTANGGSEASKRDGTSWETAWAGTQLKAKLDGIKDASPSHVYLFLVAAGVYKAGAAESEIRTDKNDIGDVSYWLAMKDEVAIVGGWDGTGASNGWKRGATYMTNFKGSKDDSIDSRDFSVLYNKNLKDKATLAYATVSHGRLLAPRSAGGGMFNYNSSPVLMSVTFSDNKTSFGGGMLNVNSSPVLTNVTFSGNSAGIGGGGMYNRNSSPVLTNVTFSNNSAGIGGGMANDNDGGQAEVTTVVNSIFWGNTVEDQTQGSQIYLSNDKGGGSENINLYNCIIEGGLGVSNSASTPLPNPLTLGALSALTDKTRFGGIGVEYTKKDEGGSVNITYENVYGAGLTTQDLNLGALAKNGGSVETVSIGPNSFAIDKGLYLRRAGTSLYDSENIQDWFIRNASNVSNPSNPSYVKTKATLPSAAIDVTATDARGYRRVGKPDIGAYEFGGVAP